MKKSHILALILVVFLLVTTIIYLTLLPSRVDMKMYGAEVDTDGAVMKAGDIILSGIRYDGKNKIKFNEFTLPNVECYLPETEGFQIRELSDKPYEWISGAYLYEGTGQMEMFDLYLSTDYSWCAIKTESNRYFVGSIDTDFDPADVLEMVSEHLD